MLIGAPTVEESPFNGSPVTLQHGSDQFRRANHLKTGNIVSAEVLVVGDSRGNKAPRASKDTLVKRIGKLTIHDLVASRPRINISSFQPMLTGTARVSGHNQTGRD